MPAGALFLDRTLQHRQIDSESGNLSNLIVLSGEISTPYLLILKIKPPLLWVYYWEYAAVHFCVFFLELRGYIKLQALVPSIQRLSHLSHRITRAPSSLFCGRLLPSTHTSWQWSGFDVPSVVYRCSRKKTKQWVCLYRLPGYCVKGQKYLFYHCWALHSFIFQDTFCIFRQFFLFIFNFVTKTFVNWLLRVQSARSPMQNSKRRWFVWFYVLSPDCHVLKEQLRSFFFFYNYFFFLFHSKHCPGQKQTTERVSDEQTLTVTILSPLRSPALLLQSDPSRGHNNHLFPY